MDLYIFLYIVMVEVCVTCVTCITSTNNFVIRMFGNAVLFSLGQVSVHFHGEGGGGGSHGSAPEPHYCIH